tara:strand:+ start:357 stop:488 length:132 start_codon:yes stop_codon:yes gene_type:complete
MSSLPTLKILDKIYDLLKKMDKRLKVIEDSIKKEKDKKQLLND